MAPNCVESGVGVFEFFHPMEMRNSVCSVFCRVSDHAYGFIVWTRAVEAMTSAQHSLLPRKRLPATTGQLLGSAYRGVAQLLGMGWAENCDSLSPCQQILVLGTYSTFNFSAQLRHRTFHLYFGPLSLAFDAITCFCCVFSFFRARGGRGGEVAFGLPLLIHAVSARSPLFHCPWPFGSCNWLDHFVFCFV